MTRHAPFLVENYIDLPLGGVDDMAIWTARSWNRLAEWIADGPPANLPPDVVPRSRRHAQAMAQYAAVLRQLAPLVLDAGIVWAEQLADGTGHEVHVDAQAGPKLLQFVRSGATTGAHYHVDVDGGSRDIVRLINDHLGDQIGNTDTPMYHRQHRWPQAHVPPHGSRGVVTTGVYASGAPLEYAGSSATSGDYNAVRYAVALALCTRLTLAWRWQDGELDIAFGAWGHGEAGFAQAGRVYLAYGPNSTTPTGHSLPSTALDGAVVYGRFGYSVATLDFNEDGTCGCHGERTARDGMVPA